MSEYIKSDVGEYLTNRTMNFEKSPPDFVWNNIEKAIPVYNPTGTVNTLVKLVIGTMSLSVIIFAVLWFKHLNFSETESQNGLVLNKKSATLIQTKNVESLAQNTQTTEQLVTSDNKNLISDHNTITQNTHKINPVTIQEKTYSINASGLKGVNEISFVDENKKTALSTKNPTPNSFGFYVIDISKLATGTYSIMITTSEGTRLHKKETFK